MSEKSKKHALKEKEVKQESEMLFEGKLFSVQRDHLFFSEGKKAYDLVLHPQAVAILPIDDDGNIILIKQWRRATGQILIEIPAGIIEMGEDPEECAQRELQEEIGYKAGSLSHLGGFFLSPGFCNEYVHLFLGKELIESSKEGDDGEMIDIFSISAKEANKWLQENKIEDAKTWVALLYYCSENP